MGPAARVPAQSLRRSAPTNIYRGSIVDMFASLLFRLGSPMATFWVFVCTHVPWGRSYKDPHAKKNTFLILWRRLCEKSCSNAGICAQKESSAREARAKILVYIYIGG